jgi:hypothetical protein
MRTIQKLAVPAILLILIVWIGKGVLIAPPPRPVAEHTAMAKCVADGGQPVRAGFVYVCVPRGATVISNRRHHQTSHIVTSMKSGATLTIITSPYGANEYGLKIVDGEQTREDVKCLDFPGTDIKAVRSDHRRARSMSTFPVAIYYDWTNPDDADLFNQIFAFGCHADASIELLAP